MGVITTRRRARSLAAVAAGVAALAVLAGCSAPPPEGVNGTPTPIVSEGTLGPAAGGAGPARTYDPALAPEGAMVRAELAPIAGGTGSTLRVQGLLPNRGYAVHAHVNPCGPTGDAAGPHYQHNPDPAALSFAPSTDPAYANPSNEMWLDLRTDASGAGTAQTQVPWSISDRGPNSIIIHEAMATMTGPGVAGTAGGRLACLDLR